jgi:serine/threonine-protein kinase
MPQFTPPLSDNEVAEAFPGRFSSVRAIYAGGQGSVFRVERTNGSCSALKIYVPDPGAGIEDRTDREVDALEHLAQSTIVTLDDHGTVIIRGDSCRFVSTTFIEGVALSARLGTRPLAVDATARIGHDIADAIDALWAPPHRIVHRDIKPQNVMLADSGHAVLIDLGVARHTTLQSLTLTGSTWGTRGYMSPEQASARKALTCKSDVFSLGVMLQQCLAGRHPSSGNQQLLANGGMSTASITTNVPADIVRLLDSMVLRDPNRRPMPNLIKLGLKPYVRPLGGHW